MEEREEIVDDIIERLEGLANFKSKYSEFVELRTEIHQLLAELYFAGVSNIEYTDDEKESISDLFLLEKEALLNHLSYLSMAYFMETIRSKKIQRYGFEFLFNLVKDFAAKSEDKEKSKILEETIEEFLKSEAMEELDELIENAAFDMWEEDPDDDIPNPFLTS